jgi:UDP-N-acetylmuramoylalanine--D-glutamate ligase
MRPSVQVAGKRFSILGGARSGLAVAGLLRSAGAEVFLSEKSEAAALGSLPEELERLGVPAEFGGHTTRAAEADALVLSPGVPPTVPLVKDAIDSGTDVVSELEVASWFCPGPIVAITGTNGKTTTTALTGRIFQDAKVRSVVAGNIGTAFSQVVTEMSEGDVAILEVSSFQLDHIKTFRPRVSVLLNITPDHLDRYDHRFELYVASKQRVFENQAMGDTLIYNAGDPATRALVEGTASADVRRLAFSRAGRVDAGAFVQDEALTVALEGAVSAVLPVSEISIRGAHNLENAMAAALAGRAMGVSAASLRATLKNFKGVEHRLEFVRELDGVSFVNDSKATNVDAVWYALQSFSSPIVVLLGGRDKGNDYSRLMEPVQKHVRAIVAIGESAEKVRAAFASVVPLRMAGSMDDAVRSARGMAQRGDVVLLSPACASFDWFQNYEHRGRAFKDIVMGLGS